MGKIIAIHGGGDWYDASADYVILNDGVDIDEEHKNTELGIRMSIVLR